MNIDYCKTHSFYESQILQNDELCAGLPPTDESSLNQYNERVISAEKDACQGTGLKHFLTVERLTTLFNYTVLRYMNLV